MEEIRIKIPKVKQRKTWAINPKTRVVPNKKKLFTEKELSKIRLEEDF